MIYFDNAATGGRKPDSVLTAVNASIRVCANPGRSGHKLSLSCAKLVQDCRNALNEYFGGYGYERVIFTKNCTEALNIAIFGTLKQGDHVVTTCLEHNSVLRPLEFLQKQGVIRYDVCNLRGDPRNANAELNLTQLKSLLRPNTRMVIITAASTKVELEVITNARSPLSAKVLDPSGKAVAFFDKIKEGHIVKIPRSATASDEIWRFSVSECQGRGSFDIRTGGNVISVISGSSGAVLKYGLK